MFKMFLSSFLLSLSLYASYFDEANKALQNNQTKKAIKLFELSAREGDDNANFQLGKIYYLKKYKRRDLNKAFKYFKKAADYHHLKAKYNLAVIYSLKQFKKHSYKSSYKLFYDLATLDYAKAQYKVGIYLLYGIGVEKDYTMAREWLERAYFKNNYKKAACAIAAIYANGLGVIQNLGRARKLSEDKIKKYPLCKKVFTDFHLHKKKYEKDRGFKYGYYK